ncbi:MAG: hypothetical protein IT432_03510 [Phycisphaerales bacterium]|nr:hypothetical protein [Phycisphaerales bacterium]
MFLVLFASCIGLLWPQEAPSRTIVEPPAQPSAAVESPRDPGLAHLPLAAEKEILAWRARLDKVACLKIVTDLDDTWSDLNKIDQSGSPARVSRQRLQLHSWMMADRLWAVIYPYKDEQPDTTFPIYQVYWSAERSMVWERRWSEPNQSFDVFRVEVDSTSAGPEWPHFDAQGCAFSTGLESLVAIRSMCLSGRRKTESGLYSGFSVRNASLPLIPPNPDCAGYWLDFGNEETIVRDTEPDDPERMHRRSDCMLLARTQGGQPELREWRTIITADSKGNGQLAYRVVWIRRFQYEFHDRMPDHLAAVMSSFVGDVDKAVDSLLKVQSP